MSRYSKVTLLISIFILIIYVTVPFVFAVNYSNIKAGAERTENIPAIDQMEKNRSCGQPNLDDRQDTFG